MPKSTNKCIGSRETRYVFYQCPCGWECLIDNIKDIKRAEKLRGMKVRCHKRKCDAGNCPADCGSYLMKMNGKHVVGKDALAQDAADKAGRMASRQLMKSQFPDVELSK
tara:strand:- start:160 stop:486 length:327 start_codon:yes stop_codon:yes gene_type:complete